MVSDASNAYVKSELAILALLAVERKYPEEAVGAIRSKNNLYIQKEEKGDRDIEAQITHTLHTSYEDKCFTYKNVSLRAAKSLVKKGDVARTYLGGRNTYEISPKGQQRLLRALPKI